jgi:uncharacterized protein
MPVVLALVFGLIFGLGIIISGMGNPAKVIAFFDIAGNWDPSLAFVMGGAVIVTAIGYRFVFARAAPVFAPSFNLPGSSRIDTPLIAGSAVFGIGWGITGFCPGAVVPMLAIGRWEPAIFMTGLLGGLIATRAWRVAAYKKAAAMSSAR